jgi:hypothetical protein
VLETCGKGPCQGKNSRWKSVAGTGAPGGLNDCQVGEREARVVRSFCLVVRFLHTDGITVNDSNN